MLQPPKCNVSAVALGLPLHRCDAKVIGTRHSPAVQGVQRFRISAREKQHQATSEPTRVGNPRVMHDWTATDGCGSKSRWPRAFQPRGYSVASFHVQETTNGNRAANKLTKHATCTLGASACTRPSRHLTTNAKTTARQGCQH